VLFSAPPFFVFFALYVLVHLLLPVRYRLLLIVAGGTVFYSYWNPAYVWIPHLLMLVAWAGALWMDAGTTAVARRSRLTVTIVALLVPLVFFKYTNFLVNDVLGPFLPKHGKLVDLPLPLGVSFVTFTLIAYVVDVYRGRYPVEWSVKKLAAFVVFFPHLIAGPILRPHELIPQLSRARSALRASFTLGVATFAVGLVKKLVFADQVAPLVDAVYAATGPLHALDYLLAIYGFSLQIYCDFSGYTDMAIGLAILLGVRLPNNFQRPYTAASVSEFWRRWHITLSHWLRDYLYIPLGGNRLGFGKQMRNVIVTMALGGLWHGANWTFVIWGLVHGVGIAGSQFLRRWRAPAAGAAAGRAQRTAERQKMREGVLTDRGRLHLRWLPVVLTFHFVTVAWVFFRAPDLGTVGRVLSGPFVSGLGDVAGFVTANAFALLLLLVFVVTHRFDDHRLLRLFVRRAPTAVVWPAILFLVVLAITVSAGSSAKFIYFDF
jgi:alginate O-acetyltransferase complex protein AlgI